MLLYSGAVTDATVAGAVTATAVTATAVAATAFCCYRSNRTSRFILKAAGGVEQSLADENRNGKSRSR